MRVYLIAGEQSGDLLGARLMQALRAEHPDIEFNGIGGPQMHEQGLHSLFPMSELSLMGFLEVIPHIPRLLKRIKITVKDIQRTQPDIIVTIDSPGFCFRVADALRKNWPKGHDKSPRFVHYVAPSVWAYKPERAKRLSQIYDQVLTLLPFEPAYFEAEGMQADFVGHPLVETTVNGDGASFRTHHGIAADAKVIAVLPGSRSGELKRHIPVLRETMTHIAEQFPHCVTVIPAVPHLMDTIHAQTKNWPTKLVIADQSQEKWNAFAAADVAIAKSGTVTLELALSNTPMVVMYKVNPISAWLMRRMIITPYVTLVNILVQSEVVPELLQEEATSERILNELRSLLAQDSKRQLQVNAFALALKKLGLHATTTPSQKAAAAIAA
ncbi:MAG: lipid-A-disaccharide synthase [Alphaproteobacteria bacterium]|nr:lipid-A-disaccharide synthase [Alphaproteobacteria bacterium]